MDYPKIEEEFELTLTQDQRDPLAMVRSFGYYNSSRDWRYTGGKVEPPRTIKCKLVQVGYCSSLDEVKEKLGDIPSGLFLQPFLAKYPIPDGKGPVGIADASWVYPDGRALFPYVYTYGVTCFYWAAQFLAENWRWLVLSK